MLISLTGLEVAIVFLVIFRLFSLFEHFFRCSECSRQLMVGCAFFFRKKLFFNIEVLLVF